VLIFFMDGPLVWSNQHHQSGTLMPSGAVHTIFASEAKQSMVPQDEKLDCFVAEPVIGRAFARPVGSWQ
jgi:hypothetical protein